MKDAITQTIGLNYQSQTEDARNVKEQNNKVSAANKEDKEQKPLLTAISPGRG